MILHRRLQTAMLRAGLSSPEELPSAMADWQRLLAHLGQAFEQMDMQLLRQTTALDGARHELEDVLSDLAAEHYKLEAVLSLLPQALAALDSEGRCVFASSSFESLLGWTPEELAKSQPLALLEPSVTQPEALLSGQTVEQKGVTVSKADGQKVSMDLAIHPRFSGDRFLGCLLMLAPPQSAVEEEGPEELFGMRVALVVANLDRRQSLRRQLRQLGANVMEREPDTLVKRLTQATMYGVGFDVVLLDGTAHDTLEAIRQDPALSGLPVVGVLEEAAQAEDGRWSAYCLMPCVVEELGEILAEAMAPAPTTSVYPSVGQELSILIVEDEPINRMMVEECVKTAGFRYHSVDSAEEALLALQQQDYNVIISDWVMPEMSGPDLCRWVRDRAGRSHTYFLLLSGKDESDQVAAEVTACGADDYLVKPLNTAQLERRLRVASRFAKQEAALLSLTPARGGTPL